MTYTTTNITPHDGEVVFQLLQRYTLESPVYSSKTVEVAKLRYSTHLLATHPGYENLVKLLWCQGSLCGIIWSEIQSVFWSSKLMLVDKIIFIDKEHRGQGLGTALVKAQWADAAETWGVHYLQSGSTGMINGALEHICINEGLTDVGHIFLGKIK